MGSAVMLAIGVISGMDWNGYVGGRQLNVYGEGSQVSAGPGPEPLTGADGGERESGKMGTNDGGGGGMPINGACAYSGLWYSDLSS